MLFSTKNLIRILWLAVIVLALAAGYFQSSLEVEQKKSRHYEQKILKLENQIKEMEL